MKNNYFRILWLLIILIFFDQITKLLVRLQFPNLIYKNPGIAFGIFSSLVEIILWLVLVGLIIFIIIVFRSRFLDKTVTRIATTLILAGAIGNLIDRLYSGYIIDFIGGKILPVFNIADIYIIVGCTLFIYFFFQKDKINSKGVKK